jgi:hypothetical protein
MCVASGSTLQCARRAASSTSPYEAVISGGCGVTGVLAVGFFLRGGVAMRGTFLSHATNKIDRVCRKHGECSKSTTEKHDNNIHGRK